MRQAKAPRVRRDYWVRRDDGQYVLANDTRVIITSYTAHSALIQAKDRFGRVTVELAQ